MTSDDICGYCLIVKKAATFEAVLLLEINNFDTCTCNFSLQPYFQMFFTSKYKKKELSF